jgi:hypothetical protein
VQLHAAVDHALLQLGAPPLRHRRLFGRELAVVARQHTAVDEGLTDLDLRLHLGEHEAGVLERSHRLPERVPRAAVVGGPRQRLGRSRDAGARDGQPLLGQVRDELQEAVAFGAEQVRDGHGHIGERQLGCVLRVHADLVEVATALEAGHAALEHEQAHSLVPL